MTSPQSDPSTPKTPVVALALAWSVVGVPMSWGVYQTILKSLALFR